ncbi:hypothetical protein D3C71_1103980 [compost metagenome]
MSRCLLVVTNSIRQMVMDPLASAVAGHDRAIINIRPEHVDAWPNRDPADLAVLYRIFNDKRHPSTNIGVDHSQTRAEGRLLTVPYSTSDRPECGNPACAKWNSPCPSERSPMQVGRDLGCLRWFDSA